MQDYSNPYQSPSEAGYHTGGLSPRPPQFFRPTTTLCLVVTVLLVVQMVLDVAGLGLNAMQLNYYNQGITFQEFEISGDVLVFLLALMAVGLLQLLAVILTAIFFCIWNYRVYKNTLALGVSRLKYAAGWAAGAWFVPIFNLFGPYQIMQETWKGSDPENLRKEAYHRPVGSSLVGWWWALWIIGGIVNNAAFRLDWHAEGDLEMLKMSAIASMIGAVISAGCALMAITIVRGITVNQDERSRMMGGATPAKVLY